MAVALLITDTRAVTVRCMATNCQAWAGGQELACCTLGRARILHFLHRSSPGLNQRLLSVGTSENTHKTMPYSRRDAQDAENLLKLAADATTEHPNASTGHGRRAYVSALVRPGQPSLSVPWPGQMVYV